MRSPRSRYYNLLIKQGATFPGVLRWKLATGETARSYVGYTFRGQLRKKPGGEIIATFNCSFLAATAGYHGGISFILSAATTAAIKANCKLQEIPEGYQLAPIDDLPGKPYWYDIESQSPTGEVARELEGFVLVTGEVTT
jgi:hypothetical protein